jgi:hypothetical protein
MKVTTFKTLVFSLFVIMAFSCKKSKDEAPAPVVKTKTDLITTTTWKVDKIEVDLNKDGVGDGSAAAFVDACKLDNIYTFASNGTGSADEGTVKCNTGDPQSGPFTWAFKSNETILSGAFSFFTGDAPIKTLTETSFVFTFDDNFGTATSYRIIVSLKH